MTDTIVPFLPPPDLHVGEGRATRQRILELRKLHAVHAEIDVVCRMAKGPLAVVQTSKQYEQYPRGIGVSNIDWQYL